MNVLSINQLRKESNSLEIGSQAGRVNTHRAMDKKNLTENAKGQLKYDTNPLSFLNTSFY